MLDDEASTTTEAVRRFNRFYTHRIGILEESLLGSGLGLSEARIVFELGRRGAWTAGAVATEFGLDPGHVSRLLTGLEKRKLIARKRSETDGRQAILSLTARGRERYQFLDTRSKEDIGALLSPLAIPTATASFRRWRRSNRCSETPLHHACPTFFEITDPATSAG